MMKPFDIDIGPPARTAHEGWHEPLPREVPPPTFWPFVMALAITVCFWAVLLDRIVLWVGLALLVLSITGWVGDLLRDQRDE